MFVLGLPEAAPPKANYQIYEPVWLNLVKARTAK